MLYFFIGGRYMKKTIFKLSDFVVGMPFMYSFNGGNNYFILTLSDDKKTYTINENDEHTWVYNGDNPEWFVNYVNDIVASRDATIDE
jgi:hypothetical protein